MKIKVVCLGCIATTLLSIGVLAADPEPYNSIMPETKTVYVYENVEASEPEEENTNVVKGEDIGEDFFTEDPADVVVPDTNSSEDSGISDDIACDDNWTDAY